MVKPSNDDNWLVSPAQQAAYIKNRTLNLQARPVKFGSR